MQILTEGQIIDNLSPCFRPIFGELKRQKVYSSEQILYAADFTDNMRSKVRGWGFMIFTDQRYLKVSRLDSNSGVSYYRTGSTWDKIVGNRIDDRRWVDPYRAYKKSYLANLKLPDFLDCKYSGIKGVIRNDYSAQDKSEQVRLVELRFEFYNRYGDIYKTFRDLDGIFICDLLTVAIRNDGKYPL